MPYIGPLELSSSCVIVLLVFGPKRLPGLGRQLGSGMREFKDSITGKGEATTTTTTTTTAAPADRPRPSTASAAEPEVVDRRGAPAGPARLARRTPEHAPGRATAVSGPSATRIGSASSSTSTSCARG